MYKTINHFLHKHLLLNQFLLSIDLILNLFQVPVDELIPPIPGVFN